jgi:hypothetical protein
MATNNFLFAGGFSANFLICSLKRPAPTVPASLGRRSSSWSTTIMQMGSMGLDVELENTMHLGDGLRIVRRTVI